MTVRDTTAAAERVLALAGVLITESSPLALYQDARLLAEFVLRAVPALEAMVEIAEDKSRKPTSRLAALHFYARAVLSGDAGTEET